MVVILLFKVFLLIGFFNWFSVSRLFMRIVSRLLKLWVSFLDSLLIVFICWDCIRVVFVDFWLVEFSDRMNILRVWLFVVMFGIRVECI